MSAPSPSVCDAPARRWRWPIGVVLLATVLAAPPALAIGPANPAGEQVAVGTGTSSPTVVAGNGFGATNRDGRFTRRATTGARPSERSTPAVAAVGNSIYLFGGVKDDFRTNVNTFYDDLYRFHPASDRWTRLEPTGPRPPARAFAAASSHEKSGRMFVHGGATYGPLFAGFTAYDDLWSYDVATGAWTEMPAGSSRPVGRSRPNMWTVGDRLYVFGGVTATFETLNDLWVYDLRSRAWSELIPNGATGAPPSRHEAQAGTVPVQQRLTLYGGEAVDLVGGAFFELLPDTWELDLRTLAWHDVTPPPKSDIQPPRNYGSAVVIGESLYLHGGDVPGGSSGCGAPFEQNPVDEVWRFDIPHRTWRQLEPAGARAALKRTAAAAVDGRMYIFSGFDFECEAIDDPGQIWNLDVWSFDPGPAPTSPPRQARAVPLSPPVRYEPMDIDAGRPHPFPRTSFSVAPGKGGFFLFGGAFEHFRGDTPLYEHHGDLWRFSWTGRAGRWDQVHGCDPDDLYCHREPCTPAMQPACDLRLESPSSRAFASMATVVGPGGERSLALFGGSVFTRTFQNVPRPDSFWLYDIAGGSWEELTPTVGAGPSPRAGSVGVADGRRFYVFGGVGPRLETYNDLWVFDLSSRQWTLLSADGADDAPAPRLSAHGAIIDTPAGKRLVIYGGEMVDVATFTFTTPDDTWEFEIDGGGWNKLVEGEVPANITPTRNYAAAGTNAAGTTFTLHGGDVVGGSDGCGALFFEDPTNEVWGFDHAANRWQPRPIVGPVVPPGAKRHGAVQVGRHMYVMGGWEFVCDEAGEGPGQVFNTDVFRFVND